MSLAQVVLERLDKVREAGPGRWRACCPAHDDRHPSLSVREVDGRLLLHCWTGCDTQAVLDAVGLQWRDLFADSLSEDVRREYVARRRERELRHARMVVTIAEGERFRDVTLAEEDAQAVRAARTRLEQAGEVSVPPRSLLPVGGRLLWARRQAGRHPAAVWVLAGGDWSRPPRTGALLQLRDATPPAALDWRVVAGLPVHVVPRGHPALPALVAGAAEFGAPVLVHAEQQHDAADWLPGEAWSVEAREDYVRRRRRAELVTMADELERDGAQKGARGPRKRARSIRALLDGTDAESA